MEQKDSDSSLNLKAGEWVEVRSREEVLATLDQDGCLESLPFMPEMFAYCGQRLRVYKRAHKTCDTINFTGGRRMHQAVHLADIRCDGAAHGGCQAGCLIFWKEAWLKRVEGSGSDQAHQSGSQQSNCTEQRVLERAVSREADSEPVYRCQATELLKATTPLSPREWDQYWQDFTSRNEGVWRMFKVGVYALYTPWLWKTKPDGLARRLLYWIYYGFRIIRGQPHLHPRTKGRIPAGGKTPTADLGIQRGERVRVKPFAEILDTIDEKYRNRGMKWDAEMVPYCGGTYTVRDRVERIVDEKTGKMLELKNPCLTLEGVVCCSRYSECRWFCPRAVFPYWREIWVERTSSSGEDGKRQRVT